MASKPMKRWFISLVFREVQSKTTMSHHNLFILKAKIKKTKIPTVGKDIEHLELLYIAGRWKQKMLQQLWKIIGQIL